MIEAASILGNVLWNPEGGQWDGTQVWRTGNRKCEAGSRRLSTVIVAAHLRAVSYISLVNHL